MRALLPSVTLVFALISVVQGNLFGPKAKANNASTDAQIYVYPFTSLDCSGESIENGQLDLKQGECVNFNQALSLKPVFRSDHADWIKEVNDLQTHCKLLTFSAFGCLERNRTVEYEAGLSGDLPQDFKKCLVSRRQKDQPWISHDSRHSFKDGDGPYQNTFYSARFVCSQLEKPDYVCTRKLKHTSWSMDPTYGAPHSSVITATYTGSLAATAHVAARNIAAEILDPARIEDHHLTLTDHALKPGPDTTAVWMLNPWSDAFVCYSCYTKKAHDYSKIECRAGKSYPADCGAPPAKQHATAHTTTTETKTETTTTHAKVIQTRGPYAGDPSCIHPACICDDCPLAIDSDSDSVHLGTHLHSKRSWHTPVKFPHPFLQGSKACADAEWEKRGQGEKSYIKIQHVHICDDKKDRADSQWIGLPQIVVHTVHKVTTTTSTIEYTSYPSPRHDQL